MKPNLVDYTEKVIDYLEYLGYPAYVNMFAPEYVAKAVSNSSAIFHASDESYRMCAIAIFGLTLEYQVKPWQERQRVN